MNMHNHHPQRGSSVPVRPAPVPWVTQLYPATVDVASELPDVLRLKSKLTYKVRELKIGFIPGTETP